MGTNYYAYRIPSSEVKDEMKKCIDTNNFNRLSHIIEESCESIHICKISFGWQTLFEHHDFRYYNADRESIGKFLSDNVVIYDEYGEHFTKEQFWDAVDGHNSNERNHWTSLSYMKDEGERPYYVGYEYGKMVKFIENHGYKVEENAHDFLNDGLRFSVFNEFS